jgi:hypothetical protein
MPVAEATATATTTPKATKTKASKAAKKAPKAGSNGKAKKGADKAPRVTLRDKVFAILAKAGETGLTFSAICEKTGGKATFVKAECESDKPRMKKLEFEDQRAVSYTLTAAGRKAIENGTVNSGAPRDAE